MPLLKCHSIRSCGADSARETIKYGPSEFSDTQVGNFFQADKDRVVMIHFSPNLGLWSEALFWYVAANMLVCLPFTVVVIVGGISDLRFLLRSLGEEEIDVTDNGRVEEASAERAGVSDLSSPVVSEKGENTA